jgi:hypothetical protein
MIYLFRQVNHIPPESFVALEDLAGQDLTVDGVVLLDDFAGTAQSAIRLWHDHIAPLQAEYPACKFLFGCMVAHDAAITALQTQTGLIVEVAEVIPASERAFDHDSVIFSSPAERERAALIIRKYSGDVPAQGVFGYGNTQSLVGFFFNTPDNTFPLFWMSSDKWRPLLQHGADPMLFASEVVTGRGPTLPASTASTMAMRELEKLEEEPEIDADSAILLLNEFSTTLALKRLQPIVARLNLQTQPLGALLRASQKIRHAVHEQHPVCTAIFIVPESAKTAVLERCYITPASPTSLSDEQLLRQMCELVDGLRGAVVASATGEVLGAILYTGHFASPGLPRRLVHAAGEARNLGALGFVFVGNGRATVLADGERVLTHRQSTWYPLPSRLLETLRRAEQSHDIREGVLRAVYDLALDMSDSGEGAIFMVGDEPNVSKLCDTRPSTILWKPVMFNAVIPSVRVLARQDGAMIIDARGGVVRGMSMLRPPAEATADVRAGTGARHSSAAKTTAVTNSVAVVVSSDGAISLFAAGKRLLRDMT